MKRHSNKILPIFCLISLFVFTGCSSKKEELTIKKIEISKVTFNSEETFDTDKIRTEKKWFFDDSESMKVIFNETVVGNLEPRTGKVIDKGYNTYHIKIFHNETSTEEWIFWLDQQFSKDGIAENKEHKGIYKLLNKKDVSKIGQLLKD